MCLLSVFAAYLNWNRYHHKAKLYSFARLKQIAKLAPARPPLIQQRGCNKTLKYITWTIISRTNWYETSHISAFRLEVVARMTIKKLLAALGFASFPQVNLPSPAPFRRKD